MDNNQNINNNESNPLLEQNNNVDSPNLNTASEQGSIDNPNLNATNNQANVDNANYNPNLNATNNQANMGNANYNPNMNAANNQANMRGQQNYNLNNVQRNPNYMNNRQYVNSGYHNSPERMQRTAITQRYVIIALLSVITALIFFFGILITFSINDLFYYDDYYYDDYYYDSGEGTNNLYYIEEFDY